MSLADPISPENNWLLEHEKVVTRRWCPTCEPDVDQVKELVEVYYCCSHVPDSAGEKDGYVTSPHVELGFVSPLAEYDFG